jgi:chemotaxis response regulator CheB
MPSELPSNDVSAGGLVVGIGASAGGLAAFKSFLANTPADSGMPFILVQHRRGSTLSDRRREQARERSRWHPLPVGLAMAT